MTKNSRSKTKKGGRMKRRRSAYHYYRALSVALMALAALFFGVVTVSAQQEHSNGRGPRLSPDSADGSTRLCAASINSSSFCRGIGSRSSDRHRVSAT